MASRRAGVGTRLQRARGGRRCLLSFWACRDVRCWLPFRLLPFTRIAASALRTKRWPSQLSGTAASVALLATRVAAASVAWSGSARTDLDLGTSLFLPAFMPEPTGAP